MSNSEDSSSSQSAAADTIIAQLEKIETSLKKKIQNISKRVRLLEKQVPQLLQRRVTESSSSHWADRSSPGLESPTDIS
uniref:Uncharacterized protein n=1 Tax=Amphimedon queenslandica TaxID=400682 RepID=A0A1X7UKA1_AMPQE